MKSRYLVRILESPADVRPLEQILAPSSKRDLRLGHGVVAVTRKVLGSGPSGMNIACFAYVHRR
jgi:hypothetical protein